MNVGLMEKVKDVVQEWDWRFSARVGSGAIPLSVFRVLFGLCLGRTGGMGNEVCWKER